jgi:hypothetical protein
VLTILRNKSNNYKLPQKVVDIIVNEFLDFKNAHKLPRACQDAIFKLVYNDFDLKTLACKHYHFHR